MGNKSSKPNPTPKTEGGGAIHDDKTSCIAAESSQPPKAEGYGVNTTIYTSADRVRTLLLCSLRAQTQRLYTIRPISLMYRERSITLRILHYTLSEIEACVPMTKLRQQLVSCVDGIYFWVNILFLSWFINLKHRSNHRIVFDIARNIDNPFGETSRGCHSIWNFLS